jgi:hypothetical protein
VLPAPPITRSSGRPDTTPLVESPLTTQGCDATQPLLLPAKSLDRLLPHVTLLVMGGKRRNPRFRLLPAAMVAAVVLAAVWVARSPHRNDLATYWGFVLGAAALALGIYALRLAKKQDDATPDLGELDQVADQLAKVVRRQWQKAAGERSLLSPIPVRWQTPAAMAGPISAAVESPQFTPLPMLRRVEEQFLLAGGGIDDLHAVYGGLGSGRLMIAGAPGSGKTGMGVLLVLRALKYREQVPDGERPQVPVPVLFTLRDWDPRNQDVQDWLTRQLQQTYPFLADEAGRLKAAELIAEKRVDVILDGLDEIAEELRPVALRALSQQATSFRVVVLGRTAEMVSAASQRVLADAAAVELQRIDPEVAANYLTKGQVAPLHDGWRDLVDRIRSDRESPLAQALSTPLALTLVRDTCQSEEDVRDLLAVSDATDVAVSDKERVKHIVDHLLDGVLPAAYSDSPDHPLQYDLRTAKKALGHIAARMDHDLTYNLEWWRLPTWSPWRRRAIPVGLVAGVPAWLVTWLVFGFALSDALFWGAVAAFLTGIAAGALGTGWRRRGSPPWKTGRIRLRWAAIRMPLMIMLASGLVFGLLGGLWGADVAKNVSGILWGIVAGLVLALALGLRFTLPRLGDPSDTSFASPDTSWRTARTYGRVLGLVFGLLAGLCGGLVFGLTGWGLGGYFSNREVPKFAADATRQFRHLTRRQVEYLDSHHYRQIIEYLARHDYRQLTGYWARHFTVELGGPFGGLNLPLAWGLLGGLSGALLFGLIGGLSAIVTFGTWPTTLASLELAYRWHTPVRLMRFLEDARGRGVLRTVGPVYQFRHAQLQDRLAEQATAAASTGQTGSAREALRQAQELLAEQEQVLGPDHPDTLLTRSDIAVLTRKTGHANTALRLAQELLADRERVLGPDHPDTLETRMWVALWIWKTGDRSRALRLYQELLPDQERVLGADHADTRQTRQIIELLSGPRTKQLAQRVLSRF